MRTAGPDQLAFLRGAKYRDAVKDSGAGAVLVGQEMDVPVVKIVVEDVDVAFARIAGVFHPVPRAVEHSIDPTAAVDPSAELNEPVRLEAHAVVEAGARVGQGSILMAGSVVGKCSVLGEESLL